MHAVFVVLLSLNLTCHGRRVQPRNGQVQESKLQGHWSSQSLDVSKRCQFEWPCGMVEPLKALSFMFMARNDPVDGNFSEEVLPDVPLDEEEIKEVSHAISTFSGMPVSPYSGPTLKKDFESMRTDRRKRRLAKKAKKLLKDGFLDLLLRNKELRWKMFSEDFKLIDQAGAKLEGIGINKILINLLRRIRKRLKVEVIQVHFVQRHLSHSLYIDGELKEDLNEPFDPYLVVLWEVQLRSKDVPFGYKDIPIEIDAEMVFHFNHENKVDFMQIDRWLVNNQQFIAWPDIRLFDSPSRNLMKIEEWVLGIKELQPLDRSKVIGTLKEDVLRVLPLRKEPSWWICAEKMKLVDQTGAILEGLQPIRQLFRLVRKMHRKFKVKDVQVHFIENNGMQETWRQGNRNHGTLKGTDEPLEPFFVARWKLTLCTKGIFLRKAIDIEAEILFHFNHDNRVDYMWMDKWLVNGQMLNVWPDVVLSDDPAGNLKTIEQWLRDVKNLQSTSIKKKQPPDQSTSD